jgi:hypothetical protein
VFVTSNVHRRYKCGGHIRKGIPAVFTANINPLLFPFLKEFGAAASGQAFQWSSGKFPKSLPGKAPSQFNGYRRCAINDYYAFVKNLPELR